MNDIRTWLTGLGLQQYAEVFSANDIDLASVRLMTDDDFEKLGVTLGHRKRLLKAAATLADLVEPASVAAPVAFGAERRQLTVMFCDLAGSTELSARLDPEDLREIIDAYQRACAEVIGRFHGYVAKYMGDGVLAYFGYPQARENAADLAVHAGLGIVRAVNKLDGNSPSAKGSRLAVRVGIATGEVVVGDQIGIDSSREWSVVGDTPNLAARLQTATKPGKVMVADSTRLLTRENFFWSEPIFLALKGFDEPVRAWEANEEITPGSNFGSGPTDTRRRLIGRQSELALFGDRLELARSGLGQVILLIGEAGIGKSAITRALIERARSAGIACVEFHCSPFYQSSELKPFAIQIERDARIIRGDTPAENFSRLRAWLADENSDTETNAALLTALLSLPTPSRDRLSDLTPGAMRTKTLDLIETHLLGLGRGDPVLLVIEDAHWIDPTSGELLGRLVDRIGHRRIVLFANARLEFDATWTRRPNVTLLTLNRLSRRDAAELMAEVATSQKLPPELVEQLLTRSGGNPLFIQELTKSVLEAVGERDRKSEQLSAHEMVHLIPVSLRDSLTERLDRLGGAKELAQAAAVIGQDFDERLLAAITDRPEQQRKNELKQLEEAEIVVWRGSESPTTYMFRHALIQETAYQSLLKVKRRELHRRIAEKLEAGVVPELAAREPERIAQHYTEAGIIDRAIECWHQSGMRAARRSADIEAIKQLSQALELVRQQPASPDRAGKELSVLIALGPTLMATGGWNAIKVQEVYDAALTMARETGRSAEMFPVLWGRWLIAHAGGAAQSARELLQQLSDVAQSGDPDLMMQFHHAAGSNHCTEGEFSQSVEHAEACIAGYQLERHRHQAMQYGGHDPCVCTTCIGALAQFALGRAVQAQDWSDHALTLAGKLEHVPSIAHAHVYRAELCQIRGEFVTVIKSAEHALAIGLDKGLAHYVTWAKMMRGWALTMGGQIERGPGEMEEGYAALLKVGIRYHAPHRLGMRAQTYAAAARKSEAVAAIEEALASVKQTGETWYEAELIRIKAELLRAAFPADRLTAETLLEESIATANRQGAHQWESRARIDLAKLLAEQSREAAARDVLGPMHDWSDIDIPERTRAAKLMDRLTN
jgi:predicted ATPase/class 3 adenylate cyclase